MKLKFAAVAWFALTIALGLPALGQSGAGLETTTIQKSAEKNKKTKGPGREIASGGGDVGKGTAKGAGDLAKGTAGGVGDLATGHPIDAAASVGKGAVGAGGHVGVGAVKGGAKIGKGAGRGLAGLFHRHHK